jgi:hypothetical protein
MKVVCNGCEHSVKKFKWPECTGPFLVFRNNGTLVVDAQVGDAKRYHVSTFDGIIEPEDVVPTVRLYLNVQRLRKTLSDAPVMVIKGV